MKTFRNIVFVATLVGLAAGLAMTGLQQFGTQPLIVKAEVIEQANAAKAAEPHDHAAAGEHDHAAVTAKEEAAAASSHEHGDDEWEPADGAERFLWTMAANIVSGIGFSLLLVAAVGSLSENEHPRSEALFRYIFSAAWCMGAVTFGYIYYLSYNRRSVSDPALGYESQIKLANGYVFISDADFMVLVVMASISILLTCAALAVKQWKFL